MMSTMRRRKRLMMSTMNKRRELISTTVMRTLRRRTMMT